MSNTAEPERDLRQGDAPRTAGLLPKRYVLVAGAIFAVFLVLFVLGEAWGLPLLSDPSLQLRGAGLAAAALGVGLLVADVVLPVPSSLVMIAHGAVFGAGLGALLSLVGGVGATLVGFGLGRRGGALLTRFVSPQERATADRLLQRWGALAIIVTRPVPLLAETVAVLAGASSLGWGKVTLAALAGTAAPAVIYALAGAAPAGAGNGSLVLIVVIGIGSIAWLAERGVGRVLGWRRDRTDVEPSSGTVA
jgi:uncharacterized membrane protein YdjX (TVP38/TMEM64 family)